MDAFLISVPRSGTERIREDASVARDLIAQTHSKPTGRLELDDAWAALHFVLTAEYPIPRQKAEELGMSWDEGSLENAIMGGAATPFQSGYGPARYLSPEQARLIGDKLAKLSFNDFCSRIDPQTLLRERLLPESWDPDQVSDLLPTYFAKLSTFYSDTMARGEGILIYFT